MKLNHWLKLILFYYEIYRTHSQTIVTTDKMKRVIGTPIYMYLNRDQWLVERDRMSAAVQYFKTYNTDPESGPSKKTQFVISEPKPWRRDDVVAARANRAAEIPADTHNSHLEFKH